MYDDQGTFDVLAWQSEKESIYFLLTSEQSAPNLMQN